MESREISRGEPLIGRIIGYLKRFVNHLLHLLKKKDEWKSNLTERYIVYREYSNEEFVKTFLANRKMLLHHCHFELKITEKPKDAANPILFYVKSALKQRRDFEGNLIALEGSFNDWLIAQSGKTIGEVENAYNAEMLGKAVTTTITYYHKIARNGDVVEVSCNGYNFVE
jgi:hypothetical protein